MKWKDIIHLACLQMRFNKLRSMLCLSAVAVGIFSLILITNIGSFASGQIHEMLQSLGLEGMTVYIEDAENGEVLTAAFASHIEQEIGEIAAATPVKFAVGTYKSGQKSGNVALIGCEEDITSSLGIHLLYGQNLPDEKIVDVENPVVISEHFANTLYQRSNAVGKQLYLTANGVQERYTIIGIIEDQVGILNSALGSNMPELAYVSLRKLSAEGQADQVLFSSDADFESVKCAVQDAARYSFGLHSTLGVQNLSGYKEQVESLTHKAEFFLLLFAVFSIITAAFAIENGMLAAMQEMREELLLYRVIGFRRIDIIRFFFVFAALLCFAGAMIGSIVGMILIQTIQTFFLSSFRFQVGHLITVLMISVVLSLLAGILPALQVLSSIKKELYDMK